MKNIPVVSRVFPKLVFQAEKWWRCWSTGSFSWVKAWFLLSVSQQHTLCFIYLLRWISLPVTPTENRKKTSSSSIRAMKLSAWTPLLIPENERLLEEHPSCVESRFYWGRSSAVNQSYRAADMVKRPMNCTNLHFSVFLKVQFASKWMFTHQEVQQPGCKYTLIVLHIVYFMCFLKTEKHYWVTLRLNKWIIN